ncbi:MAG: FHIPEP family type III secretion protein [Myxococcales bacterium]|nr:FHIPEP family type III secretion protein [Myxococcales bacterium]
MTDGRTPRAARLRAAWRGWPRLTPAVWVCVLLACVLVPLPTAVMDLLLSASLAVAVVLLVASLAVRRSVDLIGFPGLLLLVTLSRLALNVATTRLILGQADAGRVIDAFAGLVVRGDLVVGAVMFAILTAVQFLVIARGAERVAEVGARFALDGLPGEQAAIDADLRAGAVSAEEVVRRRAALLERSSFHGAMDGAAKFVKGDAIAGLVITAINLLGGLAIGTMRRGMTIADSLELYGRLTIGDGLLAQIPALLVSLAAGVLVTRVDRASPRPALAWLEPAMLVIPAGLLLGLAAVPGMPGLAFVTTAAGLLCAGLWLAGLRGAAAESVEPAPRIVVRVPGRTAAELAALRQPLAALRARCAAALAIDVPEIAALPTGDAGDVRLGARVLAGLADRDGAGEAADAGVALGTGTSGQGETARPLDVDGLVVACFRAVMGHAEALLDLQQLERGLERARRRHPAAVREGLKRWAPADLLLVCRGFLRERLPPPPPAALLEAAATDPRLRATSERGRWVEAARELLVGYWLRDLVAGHARLGPVRWVRPLPDAEAELASRALVGEAGVRLALRPGERAAWLAGLRGDSGGRPGSPLVVTTPAARAAVAALVHGSAPYVAVVSTAELLAADLPLPGEPGGPAVRWWAGPA